MANTGPGEGAPGHRRGTVVTFLGGLLTAAIVLFLLGHLYGSFRDDGSSPWSWGLRAALLGIGVTYLGRVVATVLDRRR